MAGIFYRQTCLASQRKSPEYLSCSSRSLHLLPAEKIPQPTRRTMRASPLMQRILGRRWCTKKGLYEYRSQNQRSLHQATMRIWHSASDGAAIGKQSSQATGARYPALWFPACSMHSAALGSPRQSNAAIAMTTEAIQRENARPSRFDSRSRPAVKCGHARQCVQSRQRVNVRLLK